MFCILSNRCTTNIVPLLGALAIVLIPALATADLIFTVDVDPTNYYWGDMPGNPLPIQEDSLRFVDVTPGEEDLFEMPDDAYDDPWLGAGLFGYSAFDFGIWNKSENISFDGLILVISYRGNPESFSFDLTYNGDINSISNGDFWPLSDPYAQDFFNPPKGPQPYRRPGDGSSGLYKQADGVLLVDVQFDSDDPILDVSNKVIGGTDTLELSFGGLDLDFLPEEEDPDFLVHFDVYGYQEQSDPVVLRTNPNSGDLTVAVPEASTLILFGGGLIGILGFLRRKAPFLTGR